MLFGVPAARIWAVHHSYRNEHRRNLCHFSAQNSHRRLDCNLLYANKNFGQFQDGECQRKLPFHALTNSFVETKPFLNAIPIAVLPTTAKKKTRIFHCFNDYLLVILISVVIYCYKIGNNALSRHHWVSKFVQIKQRKSIGGKSWN